MLNFHAFSTLFLLGVVTALKSSDWPFFHWPSNLPSDVTKKDPVISNHTNAFANVRRYVREDTLEQAFKAAEYTVRRYLILELRLATRGRVVRLRARNTDLCLIRNFRADPQTRTMATQQLPFEYATKELYKKYHFPREFVDRQLPYVELRNARARQHAESCRDTRLAAVCNPTSKYRRSDGLCNNLQNPTWGSAMTCQPRLLPPNYSGISEFRVSRDGSPLPNPRQLSLNVHSYSNRPTNYITHMFTFFGQLLDHDIAFTPQTTTVNNEAIQCCPPESTTHPQCRPILLSEDDPFYSEFNISCINFVRSVPCPTCSLGFRQLMNQVTSTIDASFVYGNGENETNSLRTRDGTGRLRTQRSPYGDLLPPSPDPENDQCSFPQSGDICFDSGDSRVNQHNVLTSLHTVFLREHNRIVSILRALNPHWNDDRLFQETRRILGAQMQVITYKEYLPILLGDEKMTVYNLWPGRWTRYDPTKNPTTWIEFTTAAFRIGHTLINSIVANRPLNASFEPRYLRNEFFQPFELYYGLITPILEGASDSPAQMFDRHLVPDVTNYLYRMRNNTTGLDLASININRGRDHGLPTYVDTVRYCSDGTVNIRSFYDLVRYNVMTPEQATVLENNYRFVEDIDLWTGIISEIYLRNAVVGPTAACIISIQFHALKFGDRFYFEHYNEAGSFTYEQLRELRKATLSQIICLNTDVENLPRNAMLFSSNRNPYINCRYVSGIDLSYWKEYSNQQDWE